MGRFTLHDLTDKEAMDEIQLWMLEHDPTLTATMPDWVWSLTALIDDVLIETGRKYDA